MPSPLLLLSLLAAAPAPPVVLPSNASVAGLTDLARLGEVVVLPAHNADPFRAVLITRSELPCSAMRHAMMDVRGYPKRWEQMQDVTIHEATPQRIHYSYELDMMFSPRLEGIVESDRENYVQFVSNEVDSVFSWDLANVDGGCHMVHQMRQPPGVRSDFVALVRRLEDGVGDAAELAGAIAAARGYAKPGRDTHALTRAADDTFTTLAGTGTTIHLIERPKGARRLIRARRRIAEPPKRVLARIRDRKGYIRRGVDFLAHVEPEGKHMEWGVSYFGGRVTFETETIEQRTGRRVEITERVVDGDLRDGSWVWRVTRVPGGSLVELEVDIDVTQGSMVLSTLARQDPMLRRTNALQVALEYMRAIIGGRLLPVTVPRVEPAPTPTP